MEFMGAGEKYLKKIARIFYSLVKNSALKHHKMRKITITVLFNNLEFHQTKKLT